MELVVNDLTDGDTLLALAVQYVVEDVRHPHVETAGAEEKIKGSVRYKVIDQWLEEG